MVKVLYSTTSENLFIQLPCQAAITASTDLWQTLQKE